MPRPPALLMTFTFFVGEGLFPLCFPIVTFPFAWQQNMQTTIDADNISPLFTLRADHRCAEWLRAFQYKEMLVRYTKRIESILYLKYSPLCIDYGMCIIYRAQITTARNNRSQTAYVAWNRMPKASQFVRILGVRHSPKPSATHKR